MSDYKVGYGKPPKEHQFKKGQSGNPKGRPYKKRRADVPGQLAKDVLEVAGETIEIRTSNGVRKLSTQQAILMAIANKAAKGNPTGIKTWLELYKTAVFEQDAKYAMVRLVKTLLDDADDPQFKTKKQTIELLDAHIKQLERSRKGDR